MKPICLILVLHLGLTGCGAAESPGQSDVSPNQTTVQETIDSASPAEDAAAHILVAYFSATGHTKTLAQYAAETLDADLYEIVPQEPYTAADLDYNDPDSRTSREMDDPDSRPAISGQVEDMAQYDVLLLAYPIWHGQAPRIMSTFVESYDLAGKTVIPFCTSGGSGIGSSADNLQAQSSAQAAWLPGARFASDVSREQLAQWSESLFNEGKDE